MRSIPIVATALILAASPLASAAGPDADADGIAFFESKVRPVLVEHCYKCHSAQAEAAGKLKGGLRLDTREALLTGGDTGPSIEPGHADDSPLILALQYDDLVRMPPSGKLPDNVIADLARWVNDGAPDPRDDDSSPSRPHAPAFDLAQARTHWAYQLPLETPVPPVRLSDWPITDVDHYLLARLESKNIIPSPDADRPSLARRLYFDLHGLPPTPAEIQSFVDDPAPDAYERLVDRLLASPRFGERWGRHWLDVARFAESLTLRGLVLNNAWRYRDYVIDTFNHDRPYNQFLREQLAGDLLSSSDLDERGRQLIATTFLTLGNTNLEDQDKTQLDMDVVDEQIDTLSKAFLAQTIACARCHDHKFDPIPTADYYAIAGILANVRTLNHANVSHWVERPIPLPDAQEKALADHEARVASLETLVKKKRAALKKQGAIGVVPVEKLPGVVVDDSKARLVGTWKHSTFSAAYIGDGYLHDLNDAKGLKSLTFEPENLEPGTYEVRLAYSSSPSRSKNVPITVGSADGENLVKIDMTATPSLAGRFASLGRHRFERGGLAYVLISTNGTSGFVTADAVQFLPVNQVETEAEAEAKDDAAPDDDANSLKALESTLARLKQTGPTRPMVISVLERDKITDTRIHIRGSVHTLGDPAPRGFLQVASYDAPPSMPVDQSGRRELADWIASPRNPLTARVIVNRAWHWLMGAGLVRTTDNFGTTGEPPSHPELLDHLALRFINEGWSIKSLVRDIVLSRAYRLSSTSTPRARSIDPENRLLSHHNRRRLEAEEIRDAILSVSGRLDSSMGGLTFPEKLSADYAYHDDNDRRSVYVPVFRNALPELFEVFDFANPSLVVGRRDSSTVAPQALFLMNSPFVIDQAHDSAHRLLAPSDLDDPSRLTLAYRLTLSRPPTPDELRIALQFLDHNSDPDPESAWSMLFQALFASLDFRYVD